MPVNRDKIGTVGWRNSLMHENKTTLIQLANVDYNDIDKYTKTELIELYYKKLCAEGKGSQIDSEHVIVDKKDLEIVLKWTN